MKCIWCDDKAEEGSDFCKHCKEEEERILNES